MKKLFLMLAAALLMTAPAYAQTPSLVGKWTAMAQGQQGMQKLELEITADAGGKLAGKIVGGMGGGGAISEGTVAGTKVSFMQVMSAQIKMKYTGETKGDKLVLKREMTGLPPGTEPPGGVAPIEFTRAK